MTENSEKIFKEVKFCIIEDGDNLDEVKSILLDGGGNHYSYLSDMVTHVIANNPDSSDVCEAQELFEKPVVTSQWVIQSAKCKILLPLNGFLPSRTQIFSGVVVCPSQVSRKDIKHIWAMIKYHGGTFQLRFNQDCTHLIAAKPQGAKYEKAKEICTMKIVTPDWVTDCLKNKIHMDEEMYHPRLLILPKPVIPKLPDPPPAPPVISPSVTSTLVTLNKMNLIDSLNQSLVQSQDRSNTLKVSLADNRIPPNLKGITNIVIKTEPNTEQPGVTEQMVITSKISDVPISVQQFQFVTRQITSQSNQPQQQHLLQVGDQKLSQAINQLQMQNQTQIQTQIGPPTPSLQPQRIQWNPQRMTQQQLQQQILQVQRLRLLQQQQQQLRNRQPLLAGQQMTQVQQQQPTPQTPQPPQQGTQVQQSPQKQLLIQQLQLQHQQQQQNLMMQQPQYLQSNQQAAQPSPNPVMQQQQQQQQQQPLPPQVQQQLQLQKQQFQQQQIQQLIKQQRLQQLQAQQQAASLQQKQILQQLPRQPQMQQTPEQGQNLQQNQLLQAQLMQQQQGQVQQVYTQQSASQPEHVNMQTLNINNPQQLLRPASASQISQLQQNMSQQARMQMHIQQLRMQKTVIEQAQLQRQARLQVSLEQAMLQQSNNDKLGEGTHPQQIQQVISQQMKVQPQTGQQIQLQRPYQQPQLAQPGMQQPSQQNMMQQSQLQQIRLQQPLFEQRLQRPNSTQAQLIHSASGITQLQHRQISQQIRLQRMTLDQIRLQQSSPEQTQLQQLIFDQTRIQKSPAEQIITQQAPLDQVLQQQQQQTINELRSPQLLLEQPQNQQMSIDQRQQPNLNQVHLLGQSSMDQSDINQVGNEQNQIATMSDQGPKPQSQINQPQLLRSPLDSNTQKMSPLEQIRQQSPLNQVQQQSPLGQVQQQSHFEQTRVPNSPLDQVRLPQSPLDQIRQQQSPLDQIRQQQSPMSQMRSHPSPLDQVRQQSPQIRPHPSPLDQVRQQQSPMGQRQQPSPFDPNRPQPSPLEQIRQQQSPLSQTQQKSPLEQVRQQLEQTKQQSPLDPNHRQPSPLEQFRSQQSPLDQMRQQPSPLNHIRQQSPLDQFRQQQSPMSQIRQQLSPLDQIRQQQSPLDQIRQQQSPLDQLRQQQSPLDQIRQQQSPLDQIRQQQSPLGQIRQQQSPLDQIRQQQSPLDSSHQQQSPLDQIRQQKSPLDQVRQQQSPLDQIRLQHSPLDQIRMQPSPLDANRLPPSPLDHIRLQSPLDQLHLPSPSEQQHMQQVQIGQPHLQSATQTRLPQSPLSHAPNEQSPQTAIQQSQIQGTLQQIRLGIPAATMQQIQLQKPQQAILQQTPIQHAQLQQAVIQAQLQQSGALKPMQQKSPVQQTTFQVQLQQGQLQQISQISLPQSLQLSQPNAQPQIAVQRLQQPQQVTSMQQVQGLPRQVSLASHLQQLQRQPSPQPQHLVQQIQSPRFPHQLQQTIRPVQKQFQNVTLSTAQPQMHGQPAVQGLHQQQLLQQQRQQLLLQQVRQRQLLQQQQQQQQQQNLIQQSPTKQATSQVIAGKPSVMIKPPPQYPYDRQQLTGQPRLQYPAQTRQLGPPPPPQQQPQQVRLPWQHLQQQQQQQQTTPGVRVPGTPQPTSPQWQQSPKEELTSSPQSLQHPPPNWPQRSVQEHQRETPTPNTNQPATNQIIWQQQSPQRDATQTVQSSQLVQWQHLKQIELRRQQLLQQPQPQQQQQPNQVQPSAQFQQQGDVSQSVLKPTAPAQQQQQQVPVQTALEQTTTVTLQHPGQATNIPQGIQTAAQVTPKTKTALANLLNTRLQGTGKVLDDGSQITIRTTQLYGKLTHPPTPQKITDGSTPTVQPNAPHSAPVDRSNTIQVQVPHVNFYGHDPRIQVPGDRCLLGCVFVVLEYEKCMTNEKLAVWTKIIINHGGEVENNYSNKCTHVICESQRNSIVQQAMREGKRCVTAFWLNDVIHQKKLKPPWLALHLPSPFSDEKPCKNHIISITNFDDDERKWVKWMIRLLGAKYTGYMTMQNTLIIGKSKDGRKVSKAKDWKIPLVNVQWLHDVMFGHYDALRLPMAHKYQQFDSENHFKIDYALVPHLMAAWKVPIKITEELWKKTLSSISNDTNKDDKKRKSEDDSNQSEKRPRIDSPLLEENIPLTTQNPPDSDKKPYVMFTGIEDINRYIKIVYQLGGCLTKNPTECTHLIANRFVRTEKFLRVIHTVKFIITPEWLEQSEKQNRFIDEMSHILKDEESEKTFCFNLKETLTNDVRPMLFKDHVIYITPGVQPRPEFLKDVIEAGSGSAVTKRRPTLRQINNMDLNGKKFIVVTCDNDLHLCTDLLEKKVCLQNAEFILTGSIQQELDYESFAFT